MRLGLIGSTGHWQTYAPALESRSRPDARRGRRRRAGGDDGRVSTMLLA